MPRLLERVVWSHLAGAGLVLGSSLTLVWSARRWSGLISLLALVCVWLPWSVFWRPELWKVVDIQPRARGQVASRPDSQQNYPPRLESRIKTICVRFS